jgi:hypothetical protein
LAIHFQKADVDEEMGLKYGSPAINFVRFGLLLMFLAPCHQVLKGLIFPKGYVELLYIDSFPVDKRIQIVILPNLSLLQNKNECQTSKTEF